MKRKDLAWQRAAACALAALPLAFGGGCATKITMETVSVATAAEVAADGALSDRRESFYITEQQVVAGVEFRNAHGSHTVRFQWTNDEDELVLDSGPIPLNPDPSLVYATRRAWSALPVKGHPASQMPGSWEVRVLLDGRELEELDFKLKKP